jgi:hypothetical protein
VESAFSGEAAVKKWPQAARELFKFRQNDKQRTDFYSKRGRRFSPQLERLEERTLLSVGPLGPPVVSQPLFLMPTPPLTVESAMIWSSAVELTTTAPPIEASYVGINQAGLFALNTQALDSTLTDVPLGSDTLAVDSHVVLTLPTPSGDFERFEIVEAPILAPELAAKYPEIVTYRGRSLDNPTATIRFDVTASGLHALVLSPEGAYYVTPYSQGDASLYLSYDAGEYSSLTGQGLKNDLIDSDVLSGSENLSFGLDANSGFYGETLKTYALAVSASGEFTADNGGTVPSALSAITTTINWVNGIYENELAMRFQILAGSDALIYTNAATDPYDITQSNASMLNQSQSNVDSVIGNANYDIGHLFIKKSNFGGHSTLASAGVTGAKAKAISGNTEGFTTAHEIGHQFNALHTWNGDGTGNLSDPNNPFNSAQYDVSTSMEPGAGTTLMSYGHLWSTDENIQGHRDEYFHSKSLEQISAHATAHPPVVGSTVSTGNSAPSVAAGSDYVIPADTPFTLTATGSDANGDPVTYTWEQFNADNAQSDLSSADDGVGPLFRSWSAVSDPSRTFPNLVDLTANTTPVGELLPSLARTMDFRVTARDNHPGAGAYAYDDMSVQVVATGSPFQVTSPNTAVAWAGASTQTITWDVSGTDANGINVSDVAIKLSTDGGMTYPFVLATTTNDGSHDLTVPQMDTTQARIRVEAVDNVFFDISDADITITSTSGAPGVAIIETGGGTHLEEAGFTDTYDLQLKTTPTGGPVVVEITGGAQVEVSTDGSTFVSTGSVVLSDTIAATITVRAIDDALEEGLHSSLITHAVTASGSPEYLIGMPINELTVTLADDELPPVVGIDFDYPPDPPNYTPESPENWLLSHTAIFSHTFTDVTRDDGVATPFDLTFSSDVGWGPGSSPIDEETVPVHSISLDPLLGFNVWVDPVTLVWSDLTPGTQYEVYIFGSEGLTDPAYAAYTISQTVAITGSGIDDPAPFFQDSTTHDNELFVNDQVGSELQNLTDYAKTVTANILGKVTVVITPDPGHHSHLAGVAIREVPTPNAAPTDIALSSSTVAENESSGTAVGTLSTTDTDAGDSHTYALVAGTGDADNASFAIVGDELRTAESFDFETKSSYLIRVRTSDSGSETYEETFAITINDVIENDVYLQGTSGDDNVNIWPGMPGGADHRVRINGVDAYYDASVCVEIHVDGLGGTDTLNLYGKATSENADFNGTSVHAYESSVYDVYGDGFENAYVYSGGGADAATMLGTSGNDRFYINQAYSYLKGNGSAFLNYAKNFTSVTTDVSSGGGLDRAYAYDSPGDDILTAGETQAMLDYDSGVSPGVDVTAIGFDETSVYAVNGGNDAATLTGSPGNDRFTARDLYGRIVGNGGAYIRYAEGFDVVTGDASGTTGTDVAVLFDAEGDDRLEAGETTVSLDLDATPGVDDFNLTAVGFDQTYSYAIRGGNDTALMTGSANNDRFTSKKTYSTLKRQDGGYFNYAAGWDQVTGDVSGGVGADLAFIYDAATDDLFEAGPTQATLDYDATGSPGVDTTIIGFGEVYAYADFGGNDAAILNGSAGMDKYSGLPAYSYLKANDDSYFNYARGFDSVTANAVGAGDLAFIYGSDGNDVLNADPTSAVFTLNPTAATQVVNTAAAFDQVYAYASGGGADQAYLIGATGADTLAANLDWGYLRSTGASDYFNYVRYFDAVFADPGDSELGNDLLDDRGATYALDTDPVNGNAW